MTITNDKELRKVARCIRTLLEAEGVKASPRKIINIIKDKDLSDITNLKNEVANDMRAPRALVVGSARKLRIETFMANNWNLIKDNSDVMEVLVNAYCQGRYNKDQRAHLKNNLMSHCENQTTVEELADSATSELANALAKNKYDF